jgi:hypothetical protein
MKAKIFCKAVAVFILLCSPLPSHAENWVEFEFHILKDENTGQTQSATESFYDKESVRIFDDGSFKIWIKQSTSYQGIAAKFVGKSNDESKKMLLINCRHETFEVLSGGLELNDNELLPDLNKIAEKANKGNITDSSVYQKLADIFCTNKSK